MPGGGGFCTYNPHLEGAKVFGSKKHKLDTLIAVDEETHRPNTVNFSCPRVAQRSMVACH